MRAILLYSLIASSLLLNESVSAFQRVQKQGTVWAGLRPDGPVRINGSEFTEEIDSSTFERKDYIKRPTDKEPIPFYTHHRSIVVTVGHKRQMVLINDYEATKSSKVVAVDLRTRQARQIDLAARKMYWRNVAPDRRLWIVPDAYAFSPDDSHVLITMQLTDISARTPEEAVEAKRTYRQWWYVVDSSNGQVKHEYRTSELPKAWWKS
jgi:hypothetical protein